MVRAIRSRSPAVVERFKSGWVNFAGSYSGSTSASEAEDTGSIPVLATLKERQNECLLTNRRGVEGPVRDFVCPGCTEKAPALSAGEAGS